MIRILFLSDTHLGFDLPRRPRVARRRRGEDFFANFERALAPARRREVDLVVHGGDVFFRSRVAPGIVHRAFRTLKAIADRGVPIYLVPGNHERSKIPYPLLAQHPNIYVFDRPRTYLFRSRGLDLSLAGFPFTRLERPADFSSYLRETAWRQQRADARVLCIHQAVEGARVGPSDYRFRYGPEVVPAHSFPPELTAVLAGHIHRAQALTRDGRGRDLPVPILYPGSIERTSFAEKNESKGYLTLAIETEGRGRGRLRGWRFHPLPARPMVDLEIPPELTSRSALEAHLREELGRLPRDSIVRIRKTNGLGAWTSAELRALAPQTMNLDPPRPRVSSSSSRSSPLDESGWD